MKLEAVFVWMPWEKALYKKAFRIPLGALFIVLYLLPSSALTATMCIFYFALGNRLVAEKMQKGKNKLLKVKIKIKIKSWLIKKYRNAF